MMDIASTSWVSWVSWVDVIIDVDRRGSRERRGREGILQSPEEPGSRGVNGCVVLMSSCDGWLQCSEDECEWSKCWVEEGA